MKTFHSTYGQSLPVAPGRPPLRQLGRFCGVGLACLFFSVAILVGLHAFAGLNYLFAYALSFIVGNIAGYLLNARFTLFVATINHAGAFRYMAVNGVLLCVSTAVMRLLVVNFTRNLLVYLVSAIPAVHSCASSACSNAGRCITVVGHTSIRVTTRGPQLGIRHLFRRTLEEHPRHIPAIYRGGTVGPQHFGTKTNK